MPPNSMWKALEGFLSFVCFYTQAALFICIKKQISKNSLRSGKISEP